MEVVNLAVGDELTMGPAVRAATVRVEVEPEGEVNLVVRDALAHRAEQIEALRRRVAELEAQQGVDSERVADQIIEHLRERLA